MTYEEALIYIHSHKRFASVPTLDRMKQLMRLLDNPQRRMPVVLVGGTNGKGSTAAMIAGVLTEAGFKTGLTISPYIVDFCERIQISGQMIPRTALVEEIERIRPSADRVAELTEFELVTAAAYDYFARQGCEIAVAEVGLGGRFDATNVVEQPIISVITQIGLDHTEILGDTIEKIAFEKCGIIRSRSRVVTCGKQDVSALAVILEQCFRMGATLVQPTAHAAENIRMDLTGTTLTYNGLRLHIPLAGMHQVDNTLTAVTAVFEIFDRLKPRRTVIPAVVERGVYSVKIPARLEILRRAPLVLLDGAHNPQSANVLADALELAGDCRLTAVMGMLADKNVEGALRILAPRFSRIFCVTPDSPRALPAAALAKKAAGLCGETHACGSLQQACIQAMDCAKKEDGAVIICGSLYLASEARRLLLNL